MTREIVGSCEQRAGDSRQEAKVKLITGGERTLVCTAAGDELLFEGDIVVTRQRETFGVTITGARFRWPGRVVVYDVRDDLPDQERVTGAIAHWEANTVMRFKRRTNEQDYVLFRPGTGCSSAVGKVGGVQFITLGAGCSTGNTIHEIGHAVGLWHEQSREDRDAFIAVDWTNIDDLYKHNFDQHIADGDDRGGYDYGSIMHYPANAFAVDPARPTIAPKQQGVFIGQRERLSAGDIAAVAEMYAEAPQT